MQKAIAQKGQGYIVLDWPNSNMDFSSYTPNFSSYIFKFDCEDHYILQKNLKKNYKLNIFVAHILRMKSGNTEF